VSTTIRSTRLIGLVAISILTLLLVACSPADDGGNGATEGGGGGGGGTATVENGTVAVSSNNLEFDVATIEAPAGEAFTIVLTNEESQPHNVAVYTEENGDEIVIGEIITGPGATTETQVPALDAGTYYFRCDVHPDMEGEVVIS
jgi:plastocyanin